MDSSSDEEFDGEQDQGTEVDPKTVYINFLKRYCLGKTHIACFDDWIGNIIYHNVHSAKVTTLSGHTVKCINLEVRSPSYTRNNVVYKLTPAYAKEQLLTYAVTLVAEMVVEDPSGALIHSSPNIQLAQVPVMVKSIKCNLRGLTDAQRSYHQDDNGH